MSSQSNNEKKTLKVVFLWVLGPILFLTFLRMFHVLFTFVIVALLLPIFGIGQGGWIEGLAFILGFIIALVFAIAVFLWLYRQFKKHIVEG